MGVDWYSRTGSLLSCGLLLVSEKVRAILRAFAHENRAIQFLSERVYRDVAVMSI